MFKEFFSHSLVNLNLTQNLQYLNQKKIKKAFVSKEMSQKVQILQQKSQIKIYYFVRIFQLSDSYHIKLCLISNLSIKFLILLMQRKIMVMGGTGPSGKSLLKLLSTKDVQVIATTRNPDKVKQTYPNVKWIKADIKDRKTYIEQLKGCSAVLSVLGSQDKKTVDIFSKGYPQIFKAMQQSGCHRIILVTATHDHPDQPFVFKHFVKPMFLSHMFDDMAKLDTYLKNYSGPVKFTNVRPPRLMDGKRKAGAKEKCVLAYTPQSKDWTFECHMDYLAEVMLGCWEKGEFENKTVDIGTYK